MVSLDMSPVNTRLWKEGPQTYKLLVASSVRKETVTHTFEGMHSVSTAFSGLCVMDGGFVSV